ncbi:Copper amine oxidase [Apiospora hydei]|uniref:Amine oxidase n=1 Tax=Apiospora hydei TaxID=1337664 RepID=A0ABR1V3G2_9PEZI
MTTAVNHDCRFDGRDASKRELRNAGIRTPRSRGIQKLDTARGCRGLKDSSLTGNFTEPLQFISSQSERWDASSSLLCPFWALWALWSLACPGRLRRFSQCPSCVCHSSAVSLNVWAGLTNRELSDAITFLFSNKELNLTEDGGNWDNRLLAIDLLQPNKTSVLPYVAGTGPAPPVYARANLLFGATEEPYMEAFVVGPLPLSNSTTAQPLSFFSNRQKGSKIRVHDADFSTDGDLSKAFLTEAADVLKILWNVGPDGVQLVSSSPVQVENGQVTTWYGIEGKPKKMYDTGTLLPLGLYIRANITGRDTSKWVVNGWLYNDILYNSLDEFRKAVTAPGFKSLGGGVDGAWSQLERDGDDLPFDDLQPPTLVQPGAKRFSVDTENNFVSWMDFTFFVSDSRDLGVRLFDIRFKGKRILYELGMEEAMAHYAGQDPIQSGAVFLDTYFGGFGGQMVSLVNGYDCPGYSTYLNTTYVDGTTRKVRPNGICLFESDPGYPIQRHSGTGYTSIAKNVVFTLRTVTTAGNYDYMTSYDFHLDGAVTIHEYGFKIHDDLSGSMHDHVITFKADFDILGEKNSLQKVEFVPTTETYHWNDNKPRNTMKVKKSFIANEDDAKINWETNSPSIYAVVNKDELNKFGEAPGYRIHPAAGVIHLTVKDSSVAGKALNVANHHLHATKFKDTEVRASSPYNLLDVEDPLVDFAKFQDSESLDQEDLVLWFNLGMHHVFTTAHTAMLIEPFNYLPGSPHRATKQMVHLTSKNGTTAITRYGATPANCAVDSSQFNPKPDENWSATIAIRKNPYDGSQPDHIG